MDDVPREQSGSLRLPAEVLARTWVASEESRVLSEPSPPLSPLTMDLTKAVGP